MSQSTALVGTVDHVSIAGISTPAGGDLAGLSIAGDAVNAAVASSLPSLTQNPTIQHASPVMVGTAIRSLSGEEAMSAANAAEISSGPAVVAPGRGPGHSR